jgi:outer membrane protein assembly factor BamE (lipoprotein component of BamABCDE complex)
MSWSTLGSILLSVWFGVGCMSAAQHQQSLGSNADRNLTVGTVQAKITRGMAAADVAEALGSPNIVTKDRSDDETWVYDKIATEASYSNDTGGGAGLVGAGGTPGSALILGGLLGSYNRSAGAASSVQRTLTVVIKFDASKRVKDFSYHTSRF